MRQIKRTHVGFQAHVKIASRIVWYRIGYIASRGKNDIHCLYTRRSRLSDLLYNRLDYADERSQAAQPS